MSKLLTALVLVSAPVAPATNAPDIAGRNEIIVQGHELTRPQIRKLVGSLGKHETIGGVDWQYARWDQSVCISVAGFPKENGQYIANEIGQIAHSVRLKAEGPGCQPNIVIIASDDPSGLVSEMRHRRHDLVSGREVAALDHFQKTSDTVRWISAIGFTGSDGVPFSVGSLPTKEHADATLSGGYNMSYDGGSLIKANISTYLSRMTVVVDSRRLQGVSYKQLADYLAFITLSQIRPSGSTAGLDSILSLFPRGDHAPAGLTTFDKAYLTALYRTDARDKGPMQRGRIASQVGRALRDPGNASAP